MRELNAEFAAKLTPLTAFVVIGLSWVSFSAPLTTNQVLTAYQAGREYAPLTILYPANDTVFPPEIIPCAFSWRENNGKSDTWLVLVGLQDEPRRHSFLCHKAEWVPASADWELIKQRSRGKAAEVTVLGFRRDAPGQILSRGRIQVTTSPDPVGAPLF